MSDRKTNRAAKLAELRDRQERLVLRALVRARSRGEAARGRAARAESLLLAQNSAARELLTGGAGAPSLASYRRNVAMLRCAIDDRAAEVGASDEVLRRCGQQLRQAMKRRKAAEALWQKLDARRAARRGRMADAVVDDAVASRAAAGARSEALATGEA